MKPSKLLVNYIPINLVLSLMMLVYFFNTTYPDSRDNFVAESILISVLMLLGSGFYLYSAKQKVDQYFYWVLTATTWLLLFLLGNNIVFFRGSRVLMSIAPVLLYVFVGHFTYLTQSPLYTKLLKILLGAATFTLVSLQTFIFFLNYTFYLLILFSIICILILSKKNSLKQRPFHREYQKYIIAAVLISFVPFIITRSFEPFMTMKWLVRFSHHTFVVLPATIGYILLKRSELYLEMDYRFMFFIILFFISIGASIMGIMLFLLKIPLMSALIVILMLCIASLVYTLMKKSLERRQLSAVNQARETFEKERLDILQSLTYDNYLETLSELIEQLIVNTIDVNGLILIWSENGKMYVFHQSGIFKDCHLSQEAIKNLETDLPSVELLNKSYIAFSLEYREQRLGKLILGDKTSALPYSELEVQKLRYLSQTISEILHTTEILNKNQSRYLKLSQLPYDDQFKLNMVTKSDDLRRTLSNYLHDDILQTILAVKNLIELLETEQDELKELVLTNITQLNDSIRNQMFELYPSTLSDLNLYQSLSILCNRFISKMPKEDKTAIKLTFDDEVDVPNTLKFPLFRMTKELIQNALKHAKSTLIEIRVVYESKNDFLYVSVIDNGIGIESNALEYAKLNNHIGLLSLKQEANLLNGELSIHPRKPSGTIVQLKLPLSPNR